MGGAIQWRNPAKNKGRNNERRKERKRGNKEKKLREKKGEGGRSAALSSTGVLTVGRSSLG